MIYGLKFDRLFEGREIYSFPQMTMLSIYDVYRRRGIKCLLMYKHKLPNLEREWINPRKLTDKYCFKNPESIDFNKIDCDYVMLYHNEIYNNPYDYYKDELRKLFEFCETNGKDLFIPLMNKKYFNDKFTKLVEEMLVDFNHQIFQISELEDQFKFEKVLTRHLKLNDLLNGEKDTE
jgi:hypothetical protein